MDENESMSKKLDRTLEAIEKIGTKKKFRLPMDIKMQKAKFKKNYILVQFLRNNGAVEFKIQEIIDNTVKINNIYYEATGKYLMRYKNMPMIVLPEWNISPVTNEIELFDAGKNLENAVKDGKLSAAEKFILHAIKLDTVVEKKSINIKMVIIILAAAAIGIYILSQLGVF